MNSDQPISRRSVLKMSGPAIATAIAGCSGDGENQPENTETQENNNPIENNPETDTQENNSESSYEPTIKKGEEFDWFIDPRRLNNKNLLNEDYDKIKDPERREMAKDTLPEIRWQIYRTQDYVEDMNQEAVDYIDENTPSVTGRGFVDADWSDMGTKVVIGLGEMGAVDVKEMTPNEIQQTLNGKFEQTEQRNGRTIYRGNFHDERFANDNYVGNGEQYEVMIGHDGGNNLIWVADRPQDGQKFPFLNEIEKPYQILDQTVASSVSDNDVLESVVDGSGHRINGAMKAAQNHFPNEDGRFLARMVVPGRDRDGSYQVGRFAFQRMNEGSLKDVGGFIYEEGNQSYDLDIQPAFTINEEPREYNGNFLRR